MYSASMKASSAVDVTNWTIKRALPALFAWKRHLQQLARRQKYYAVWLIHRLHSPVSVLS